MLVYLTQGLILGGTAAAQPGPLQAFLLSQTLKNGWRRTIWAAFAPLISDGPILVLVLLALTQLPDWALILLRIGGGLFLLYLAWGAYQAFQQATAVTPTTAESAQQGVLKAALMNFLSPNPYIFWGTIAGPILIEAWRETAVNGLAFFFGFYGALIGGFMAFVLLFAAAKRLDEKVSRVLSGISAVALFLFGLYQIFLGLSTLAR
ncbi:MAG: LysE family transporter [Chloroflexi bacterium]|nr:LysE family transporter [Chloroflexota bacterium]